MMSRTAIQIQTEDGTCPAHVFQPGGGPRPGVLMYMDGIGIREALFVMAERLASAGYYVLLPDLFYRVGNVTIDAAKLFTDPAVQADWSARVLPAASVENIMRDTRAFLAHFAAQPNVRQPKIGATGYCMGGRLALAAAGHFPDSIAAVASYHGGGLATDAPDSPHRLAPAIKARVYIGAAIEDRGFNDAQQLRLKQAFAGGGVDYTMETYQARHGWVPSDTPVHDPAAAERHWTTLLDLFQQTL